MKVPHYTHCVISKSNKQTLCNRIKFQWWGFSFSDLTKNSVILRFIICELNAVTRVFAMYMWKWSRSVLVVKLLENHLRLLIFIIIIFFSKFLPLLYSRLSSASYTDHDIHRIRMIIPKLGVHITLSLVNRHFEILWWFSRQFE